MTVLWKTQKSARLEDFTERDIEERGIELWEGEVVEVCAAAAGKSHNEIAKRLLVLFDQFSKQHSNLWCAGDNDGFIVSRDPDTFLSPDAALYRLRPEDDSPWHDFAPEIAVEIQSPQDSRPALLAKRDLYLRAEAEQVWLVFPADRRLDIHFRDGRLLEATGGVIECEGLAAGLRLNLDDLFRPAPFMKKSE